MSTRAKCCLTVLLGLVLILSGVRCVAAMPTNVTKWFITKEINGATNLQVVNVYCQNGIQNLVTTEGLIACVTFKDVPVTNGNIFEALQWANDAGAIPVAEVPTPKRWTQPPAQAGATSNQVWKWLNPVTIAAPKSGAGNTIKLPVKPPALPSP